MTTRPTTTAAILMSVLAAMALLYFLASILIPLVIAFVLVVLVDAVVTWVDQAWPKAPKWAVAALSGLVVILAATASMFILAQGAVRVVQQGPALLDRLTQLLQGVGPALGLRHQFQLKELVGDVSIPRLAGYVLSAVQGVAGAVLLIIIYFGFMLAGRRRISRKVDVIGGRDGKSKTFKVVAERIAGDIRTYLWVQAVTGAMITVPVVVVMAIVGLQNLLFWTVIFFLLTFIPNIGVTVGSIAPALFALLQFGSVWPAALIFGISQVAATVVGNLIYPRMQADTQNIDPIATIVALSFWTLLWGIPGAFLAVPMTLMLMMVLSQFESTRWVTAALSNDGRPHFRQDGEIRTAKRKRRPSGAQ